jgi:glycosyltransferase involved in cell wall biosynthesis
MESDSRIKVLHVIARMNVGGPAILVADLIRSIDSAKFEAGLVTGYCDENESDYLEEVAQDIVAIRILGLGRSISIVKDLKAFLLLIQQIKRFSPDVLHTHTAKAGVLGRLAGLIARPRAKRIHTFHGHLLHGYFDPRKVRVIILLEKILGLITYKFVAIGATVRDDLVKAGVGSAEKFEVIFPGLQDLELYPKSEARASLGLASSKKYIAFIGRLTSVKRPDRLIDLAHSLKVDHPSTQIIVAGAGELLEEMKTKVFRNSLPITFLGWRNDIGMILSASEVAILCSDNEGIPLTLIQASQAGLPIVSTDVGSVCEIVENGVNGLLTEVSSEGLIKGVFSILDDPALGQRFGKAGQERARQFFTSRAMVKCHERLYSQSL